MNTIAMQGFSMQGFGDVAVASQTEGSATKPSIWDQLNNGIKTAGAAAQVANQIKTVVAKPSSGSSSSSNPFATDAGASSSTPAQVAPVDNTKKYLAIGAGVLLIGGVVILVAKSSKKKGKK